MGRKNLTCFKTFIGIMVVIFLAHQRPIFIRYTRPAYRYVRNKRMELKHHRHKMRSLAPQISYEMGVYGRSARPFISQDIWVEIADNKRNFFVRPYESYYPQDETEWIRWLDKQPKTQPVNIIMNNQNDKPWPSLDNSFSEEILSHPTH